MSRLERERRSHSKHAVRETSIDSYAEELPALGKRQQEVFDMIVSLNMEDKYPTDREIARELDYDDPNKVRPRRYELMKLGLITEAGLRTCEVSGKVSLTWKITPAVKSRLERR